MADTSTVQKVSTIAIADNSWFTDCCKGYTRLDQIPAIVAGYRKIAELIGSLTIHLMKNTDKGDVRIQNELSRKIDIEPYTYMTRSQWMEYIIMSMFLYGKGNAVVKVKTYGGIIRNLEPVQPDRVEFREKTSGGYTVVIDGKSYNPDDVLHFVYNPDRNYPWKGMGVTTPLRGLADCLDQAQQTEHAFMESNWMPSVVVKADGLVDSFSTKEGRHKLVQEYLETSNKNEPWIIPADQLEIQEIKPLTLNDIALNDSVTLDMKKVASLLGVPPFILGAGEYNQKEWNNFVQTKIRPICIGIQQELTKKLILSPTWYLKFNSLSLLDYDINTIAEVYTTLQDRGDVSGNEVRDRLGLSPVEGLDEFKVLENYIPVDKSGDQKKLVQGD